MSNNMTIFDAISDVAFRKRHQELPAGHSVNQFLLQRWLSMHSPEVACLLNETSNTQWASMTDTQEWYDYFFTIVPKLPFKRISYIKKAKKDKEQKSKNANEVELLSELTQISKREAAEYIIQDPTILDDLKEDKKGGVYRKTKVV